MANADSSSAQSKTDLLQQMMARRAELLPVVVEPTAEQPTEDVDSNPPFDSFTEELAYHWRRTEQHQKRPKDPAHKPEASVLRSLKTWCKKLKGIDCARISVGTMRTTQGFMMKLGGELGQSDLVLTPHAGQPFERQIHVEVKRPDIIIDGKKVQRAGKQSAVQKFFQEKVETRGDKYVVVTTVAELRDFLETLGFTGLPPCRK